jgi:hypothetical protein
MLEILGWKSAPTRDAQFPALARIQTLLKTCSAAEIDTHLLELLFAGSRCGIHVDRGPLRLCQATLFAGPLARSQDALSLLQSLECRGHAQMSVCGGRPATPGAYRLATRFGEFLSAGLPQKRDKSSNGLALASQPGVSDVLESTRARAALRYRGRSCAGSPH